MLRAAVIVVAAILACSGILLLVHGVRTPGWQVLGIGLVVLLGTLFERWRYRRAEESANGQWQATGERFLDPSTGDPIEVLFDPRTGERRYVVERPRRASNPTP